MHDNISGVNGQIDPGFLLALQNWASHQRVKNMLQQLLKVLCGDLVRRGITPENYGGLMEIMCCTEIVTVAIATTFCQHNIGCLVLFCTELCD